MKVLALVNNSPSVFSESFRGLLDRKIPQGIIVAGLGSPVAHVDDRSRQNGRVDYHRLCVNNYTPVFECLLTEKIMREILDGLELLLRIFSA